MPATSYFKQVVLDAAFSGTGIDWANTYVGISLTVPVSDGTIPSEVSGGGYSRASFTPSPYPVANTTEHVWTATAAWGSISCIFISNSSQGGKALVYYTLSTPTPIESGTIVRIPIGNLTIN